MVGCCPGGTSSNVMTYMAKGDGALSIGMTAVSTVLAPILTPVITGFYVSLYNSEKIFANGILIILVVLIHNCCGYAMGFLIGKVVKLPPEKRNAMKNK